MRDESAQQFAIANLQLSICNSSPIPNPSAVDQLRKEVLMKIFHLIAALVCLAALAVSISPATAGDGSVIAAHSAYYSGLNPWYGPYYDPAWGMPLALVVPPTAEAQSHYGWGVGNYRVTTNTHQFGAGWPGAPAYDYRIFQPTPRLPTDTDQFGVYYVRGPWRTAVRAYR
jgi:hypothetical protein